MQIDNISYDIRKEDIFLVILYIVLIASIVVQGHHGLQLFNKTSYSVLLYGALTYYLIRKPKVLFDIYIIIFCFTLFFVTYLISLLNFGYFSHMNAFKGIMSFYGFVFITLILSSNKNLQTQFWKIINIVSKLTILIILIQSTLYYFFNIRLHEITMFGKWIFKAFELNSKYRPAAIFSEPSHLAEFLLLSYYYYLFIEKNFKVICLYLIGLTLSTSGLGIVGCMFLTVMYVFMHMMNSKKKDNKYQRTILTIISFILIILVVIKFSGLHDLMLKSNNWLIHRIATGATIESRVYRSFDIFKNMSTVGKIFGVGMQNQANYLNYYGIVSKYDSIDTLIGREYAQTLGYLLVTTGLIGFVTFLSIWVNIYFKNDYKIKALILLFIYICLVSNILTRYIIILYMTMIYISRKNIPFLTIV